MALRPTTYQKLLFFGYSYLYAITRHEQTLYDATRVAVREIVGQMTVDDVLNKRQGEIRVRARQILEQRLGSHFERSGAGPAFTIQEVELQVIQAPTQVQEAFDEIIAAGQGEERAISEARGDEKETLERREIAGLPTGEVYSPEQLQRAERRLHSTAAFDSVSFVEAETIAPGDILPITAQVIEAKPRRFGFGLELSSIEGLGASSYWLQGTS